jgi:hypothetical protein
MREPESLKIRVAEIAGLQLLGSVLYSAFDTQSKHSGSRHYREQIMVKKCDIENALRRFGLQLSAADEVSHVAINAFQFEPVHLVESPLLVGFLVDQKNMVRLEQRKVFPLLDRRIPIAECKQDTGLIDALLRVFEYEIRWRTDPEGTQKRSPDTDHIRAFELMAHALFFQAPVASHREKGTGYADDAPAAAREAFSIMRATNCTKSKAVRLAMENYESRLAGGYFEPGVVFHAFGVDPNARVARLVKELDELETKSDG